MNKQMLSALIKGGRYADALVLGRQLCAKAPDDVSLWVMLANVYAASGMHEGVVLCCDRIIALQPENANAHHNKGVALYSLRHLKQAEQALRTALSLDSSLMSGNILGKVLKGLGRNTEAIQVFEKLIADNTDAATGRRASFYTNLAVVQIHSHLFEAAEQSCRRALQLDQDCVEAHNNLAQALRGQGLLTDSIAQQRITVALSPENAGFHSNLLLDLNYLPDFDAFECAREHRLWGERHGARREDVAAHSNTPDPDKRLRIGYLSPDFRAQSVMFFIEPLLTDHNRDRVEIFCYANLLQPDPITHRLRGSADQWRDVWNLNDNKLAELVRNDGIDILVDLAGHTSGNRLKVFGKRPAPVQVTWLGYPNTTGLREMDYRLTDEWADPRGVSDELHTEKLIRLPNGFLCYKPLDDSPDVGALPATRSGHVTFGCFNNSLKINNSVLDVWSGILADLPEARILLKSWQLREPGLQKMYSEEFARRGVDPDRVEMIGGVDSTIDHLALYGRVDIALDTFPYNGTTTTCEAMWMGAPVIVLAGDRHAGRVGVSLLQGLGLGELIAASPDEYRRLANDLARDRNRCTAYRNTLRTRMRNAPLTDAVGFARDIEAAFRTMWHSWCERIRTGV